MSTTESQLEQQFIQKLQSLKYEYRPDIRDRALLEANFRRHFETLNRVRLTDTEFQRLLGDIVNADVFTSSKVLRDINSFTRDDGTPLNFMLVNINDWCKTHGGVFTSLTTQTIKEFEIRVPGLSEQHRIAACLSSLDDLITAQTQKLAALRTHKKALMQQLFASPEGP